MSISSLHFLHVVFPVSTLSISSNSNRSLLKHTYIPHWWICSRTVPLTRSQNQHCSLFAVVLRCPSEALSPWYELSFLLFSFSSLIWTFRHTSGLSSKYNCDYKARVNRISNLTQLLVTLRPRYGFSSVTGSKWWSAGMSFSFKLMLGATH